MLVLGLGQLTWHRHVAIATGDRAFGSARQSENMGVIESHRPPRAHTEVSWGLATLRVRAVADQVALEVPIGSSRHEGRYGA